MICHRSTVYAFAYYLGGRPAKGDAPSPEPSGNRFTIHCRKLGTSTAIWLGNDMLVMNRGMLPEIPLEHSCLGKWRTHEGPLASGMAARGHVPLDLLPTIHFSDLLHRHVSTSDPGLFRADLLGAVRMVERERHCLASVRVLYAPNVFIMPYR